MDNTTKASVSNLIRYATKVMAETGWTGEPTEFGGRGPKGECCIVASIVEAGVRSGFGPSSSIVTKAVSVLDSAAEALDKSELGGEGHLNYVARYNSGPGRTQKQVIAFMNSTANNLVKWKV